jgi:hypothetical protein
MFAQLGAEEDTTAVAVSTSMPSPLVPLYTPDLPSRVSPATLIIGSLVVGYVLYQYFYGEE